MLMYKMEAFFQAKIQLFQENLQNKSIFTAWLKGGLNVT